MSIVSNHEPYDHENLLPPHWEQGPTMEEVFANDPIARMAFEQWLDELRANPVSVTDEPTF